MSFVPPTLEDVERYIADNPKLSNIDADIFWHGYNDGGWIDTKGKPVRNWKLKLWTWHRFGGERIAKKTKLYPIRGKTCGRRGCRMPAVHKDISGGYDNYTCPEHMPDKVKELYD